MAGVPVVEQVVGLDESEQSPQWSAVWAIALGVYALSAAEMMPIAVLTPIAHDVGISPGTAGQAMSALAVTAVLTSILGSVVVRQLDRRIVLLALAAIEVASGVAVATSSGVVGLVVGWGLLGVAIGAFWSLAAALAMRLVPVAEVPKALSIVFSGGAIAGLTAPPLGSLLAGSLGWRVVFWAMAGAAALAFVVQALTLPKMPASSRVQVRELGGLLRRRIVVLGMLGVVLTFGGQRFFFAYIRPLLDRATGGQIGWVSFLLLLSGIAGLIGTVLSGRLISRSLMGTMTFAVAAVSVLAVVMIWASRGVGTTIPVLMIWGAAFSMVPVCWSTWITRAVPDQAEAVGGLQVALVQVSFLVATAVGGVLLDGWGIDLLLTVCAAVMALAAVHLWTFVRPSVAH